VRALARPIACAAIALLTVALGAARADVTPLVRVDHPFVFLIADKSAGAVLFAGRIANPATAS
jgi:serine protease inhibitor